MYFDGANTHYVAPGFGAPPSAETRLACRSRQASTQAARRRQVSANKAHPSTLWDGTMNVAGGHPSTWPEVASSMNGFPFPHLSACRSVPEQQYKFCRLILDFVYMEHDKCEHHHFDCQCKRAAVPASCVVTSARAWEEDVDLDVVKGCGGSSPLTLIRSLSLLPPVSTPTHHRLAGHRSLCVSPLFVRCFLRHSCSPCARANESK